VGTKRYFKPHLSVAGHEREFDWSINQTRYLNVAVAFIPTTPSCSATSCTFPS
jgi:hypothetical protein